MKVLIYNKGCIREDVIAKKIRNDIILSGHEKTYNYKEADFIVYITCAGVGDTIIESLQEINLFVDCKKEDATLIITGCLTKIPEIMEWYKDKNGVKIINNPDFVVPVLNCINNDNKRNSLKKQLANRTRMFYDNTTHIQFFLCNGCLNHCSFCKTNYVDEHLTSVPYEIALNYLQNMIKMGTKSITLSGENLALYGINLYKKPMLHKFIHDLSNTPGLMYLTVNEIPAQNMYPELLKELISNKKVKRLGIQLETADNRLLGLMNRRHTIEEFDAIVTPLKEASKYIDTVLMAGFPTETYEDMDRTIAYLREKGIATELICKYCDFEFIPSHELPQLSKSEKIKHYIYLREAIKEINYACLEEKMADTNNAIVYGKKDNKIFIKSFYHGYSLRKEHQELEVGDIITTPAKRIVQEKTCKMRYEYRY